MAAATTGHPMTAHAIVPSSRSCVTQDGLVRHRRARNDAPDSIRNREAAESEHTTCFFDADTHPSRQNRDVSLASYCTLRETATSVETIGPMTTVTLAGESADRGGQR